ncbi:MAG: DsbA family protein [Geminicoccaceae bacterium]
MRHAFLGLLAAIGVGSLVAAVPAIAQDSGKDLPVDQVERIVKDYLMREPEVILQAIEEYQNRQKAEDDARQKQALLTQADEIFHDDRDGVINPDGDVTLVEFFDYRCGYCRSMNAGLQSLIARDTRLRFVLKEFPILGEDSLRASRAALAAKKQGAYETFHNALMTASDMSMAAIERLAERSNLDVDRLKEDMESEDVAAQIASTLELGRSLGISGTPSFVLGDTIIPGAVPVANLAALVDEARSGEGAN